MSDAFNTVFTAFAMAEVKRIDRLIITGQDVPNEVGKWISSFNDALDDFGSYGEDYEEEEY